MYSVKWIFFNINTKCILCIDRVLRLGNSGINVDWYLLVDMECLDSSSLELWFLADDRTRK